MTAVIANLPLAYFGKLPAYGDFVKAGGNAAVAAALDCWLAQTMTLLAQEPRWKIHYDALQPLRFAFVGPMKKHAVAGYLVASRDSAQRRFPFVVSSTLAVDTSAAFLACSPLAFAPLWAWLESAVCALVGKPDPSALLQELIESGFAPPPDSDAPRIALARFMASHSVAMLDAMLARAGFAGAVRGAVLALGLLLEPIRRSGATELDQSLLLPLPQAPQTRYLVAAFWLHMLAPFVARGDFELALFFPQGAPVMAVGFAGASPAVLRALVDPLSAQAQQIRLDQTDWIAEQQAGSPRLRTLACYLEQPDLPLAAIHTQFCLTFSGA